MVYDNEYVIEALNEIEKVKEAAEQAELVVAYLHERSANLYSEFSSKIKDAMQCYYSSDVDNIVYFSEHEFLFTTKDLKDTFTCNFIEPCSYVDLLNGDIVFDRNLNDPYVVFISQKTVGDKYLDEL